MTLDLHIDLPWIFYKHGEFNLEKGNTNSQISIPMMKSGKLDNAIFALYLSDGVQDCVGEELAYNSIAFEGIAVRKQLPNAMFSLEGGRLIGEDLKKLEALKDFFDIKYLTLTHNKTTSWADSATDTAKHSGLSQFGKTVVESCEALGILVDVSHASDLTAWDVILLQTKPVIASHSGCRSLVDRPRNLPDNLITSIADTGGLVGVPFAQRFIGPDRRDVISHINHIVQLTGSCDHVAIGSDLDGAVMVEGVWSVSNWGEVVLDGLSNEGYADEQIEKIAGGNMLRLMDEVKK